MEEPKTKVILLGYDPKLLNNVTERVNESRPAEVLYFTDLKDFLEACIESSPDLVGVSVGFPHAATMRFPKLFKMAFGLPVLTFGENQDNKTRKNLSASSADLKIQGVITAHNLWMKILNYKKLTSENKGGGQGKADNQKDNQQNSVFLKGDVGKKNVSNKSSVLNSLISALNDPSQESKVGKLEYNPSSTEQEENTSHVTSHGSSSEAAGKNSTLKNSEISSVESPDSSAYREAQPASQSNLNHIQGGTEKKKVNSSKNLNKLDLSAKDQANSTDGKAPKLEDQSKKNSTTIELENMSGRKGQDKDREQASKPDVSNLGQLAGQESNRNQPLKPNDDRKSQEGVPKAEVDPGQPGFGRVQLADEKEVKEQADRKSKEQAEKEALKNKNILITASEKALEGEFKAHQNTDPISYSTRGVDAFTVDMGKFKGYLTIASNQGENLAEEKLLNFRDALLIALKIEGGVGNISRHYSIKMDVEDYDSVVSEFAEFNITHKDLHGTNYSISFVTREVIVPALLESDKDDMYLIDIKVIPPKTPVTFDAYLYLPRNKRFVRYLKEGRSLSLKQAKRHTEDDGENKLYLPKEQKREFEKFFIQNTLSWEFSIHSKKKVA